MRSKNTASRRQRAIGGAQSGLRFAARGALAAALLASVFTATAADAQPLAAIIDTAPLSAELVTPGLYRINGAGGGALLRLGTNGLIVVDSKRAGAYRPLMAEIQRIAKTADLPVRALVLTGAEADQAGNVAQFVDAGFSVLVQRRAVARLVADVRASGAAAPKPLITYDTDYLLRAGYVEAEVEHVGSGRSGADSVVYFRDLRVIAVGGLFPPGTPQPDCASGGSFAGWAAAIAHLMTFDFDVAVPSRGAPVGKRELMALKATLEAHAARVDASPSGQSDCQPSR